MLVSLLHPFVSRWLTEPQTHGGLSDDVLRVCVCHSQGFIRPHHALV